MRSQEYEKNQVIHSTKLGAIKEVIEIISSDAVLNAAEKYSPQSQQLIATAAPQLRSSQQEHSDVKQRFMSYLQSRAQKLGHRYPFLLVAAGATGSTSRKVEKVTTDLIVTLEEGSKHLPIELSLRTWAQDKVPLARWSVLVHRIMAIPIRLYNSIAKPEMDHLGKVREHGIDKVLTK